ncbi:hypothetical protein ACRALDRAFT_2027351 [Sodiomyces alcalophilus JCM 7366]|uniref:uncharacterized protein n=1 Tax=Sodiomyces alcalophilus JCM 7366 TaxID=591952 RepID=UPI0039B53AAF
MATTPPPFEFPWEYSFPPFFTRQTNLTTHHAQLSKWSDLILAYCRHYRIFKLSLSAAIPSSTTLSTAAADTPGGGGGGQAQTEELFHNRRLNRRLSLADAREVIDSMRRNGRAEYVGGKDGGDLVWVYWRTPEEWAALLEKWVDDTGQKGVVLTLYELTEGDGTKGTEFHGLDVDLLLKALHVLAKRGKAQVFGQDDSQGVKFF